jgi:hypothetical protein
MCQYGELCVCCSGTKPLKVNRFFDNNLRSRVVLSGVVLTVIICCRWVGQLMTFYEEVDAVAGVVRRV